MSSGLWLSNKKSAYLEILLAERLRTEENRWGAIGRRLLRQNTKMPGRVGGGEVSMHFLTAPL